MTVEGLAEAVLAGRQWRLAGTGTKSAFLEPVNAPALDLTRWRGVIEHSPADLVVTVWAGTPVAELQEELARQGQSLPLPHPDDHGQALAGFPGTVGGLLAMNLPHGRSAQCGGPRDWVLGATVVRGDGSVAKAGSRVVKSVAGYDLHRLLVGSRGTLAAIAHVHLRTWPVAALPPVEAVGLREPEGPCWIVRTLRSDFDATLASTPDVVAHDAESSTLWCCALPPLPAEAWAVGPGGAVHGANLGSTLHAAVKSAMDPGGRFV
jgi:FAD/FMN-containing dehydrogenase